MNVVREKYRVALISVFAAVFLTGFKLYVGLATNSLGILAEAAHSGLDLMAALMTLFAVTFSDRPADAAHHYGHGKIEGISAFIEVLLLLVTCGWIIFEAVERFLGVSNLVDVNFWSFAVMGISIIVDASRSTALYRVARKYKSQALEADALHFASDIWSSAVVIFGLVGYKFLKIPLADPIAAFIVAVLVIVISMRLAGRTIHVLTDKAPGGVQPKIEEMIAQIPEAEKIDSLRIRSAGAKTFIDMRLTLASDLSFSVAHGIATHIERKISEIIPGADAMVHAHPGPRSPVQMVKQDRLLAISGKRST
ncbi:MAG: cation diffusion facilitator family transporter [Desulfobacterales bacterium]|nr:cation diffusion facilitator family transporter [Desulfobacterales bacterium]